MVEIYDANIEKESTKAELSKLKTEILTGQDSLRKELPDQKWKEFLKTLTPQEQQNHENLRAFLDATEHSPAWQGKNRKERAQLWRKQTYNEVYLGPTPAYEK